MSNTYLQKFKKTKPSKAQLRAFHSRPGEVDQDGNIVYFTEQSHKDQCDVNNIIKKYDRNGLITHVSQFEAQFGDMTGLDFQTAQNQVKQAQELFDQLPSKIRNRFQNNPASLLEFMEHPENRKEAEALGIINPTWTEDTDGLGEHVPEGGNVNKKPEPKTETPSVEEYS